VLFRSNDEITYEAYVSEQNLVGDDPNEPVRHPLVNEIFRGKRGNLYFKPSN
jgi:heat shock protein HspQ